MSQLHLLIDTVSNHMEMPMSGVCVTDVKSMALMSDFMNCALKSMGCCQLEASLLSDICLLRVMGADIT